MLTCSARTGDQMQRRLKELALDESLPLEVRLWALRTVVSRTERSYTMTLDHLQDELGLDLYGPCLGAVRRPVDSAVAAVIARVVDALELVHEQRAAGERRYRRLRTAEKRQGVSISKSLIDRPVVVVPNWGESRVEADRPQPDIGLGEEQVT